MPIPKPNRDEPRGDFMNRCVRFLLDEGTPNEQAVAICYDAYRNTNKTKILHDYVEWKTIDAKRRALEPFAQRVYTKATNAQLKQYLDEVERTNSIDFDLDGVVTDEPIQLAYEEVYGRVMPMFAKQTYDKLLKQLEKLKQIGEH